MLPSAHVLSSASLFRAITAFARGVPLCVVHFKGTAYTAHLSTLPASARNELRLWHVAVLQQHRPVLEALAALSQTPEFAAHAHVAMTNVMGYAALHVAGDGDCVTRFLDWLYATCFLPHQCSITEQQFEALATTTMATSTQLTVVRWLYERGKYTLPARLMDAAAASGNEALVRYLHERTDCVGTTAAMDSAARNGHLGLVQFLHAYRREGCTPAALSSALQNGHVDVVRFLTDHRREACAPTAIALAVIKGQLACVQFAHARGFPGFPRSALSYAVVYGHLALVEFLHTHRPQDKCTFDALVTAEQHAFYDIVDFLCFYRPLKRSVHAIHAAASRGLVRLALRIAHGAMWSPSLEQYEYE